MGIANVIPGVSGGTIALITGIYEDLINSLKSFDNVSLKLITSIDILGFKHETDLEDGLTKMWEWAKVQPMRNQFIWPSFELDKGLYSFWKNPSKI